MSTTKEQQRSAFALQQIQEYWKNGVKKEEANFIVGMPTMILTNGVGQSMAFLLSKKDEEKSGRVFAILKKWLVSEKIVPVSENADNMQFLKKFSDLEQESYLRAQQEALAMLQWLKRYARAFEVKQP